MTKAEFIQKYPEIPAERVHESTTGVGVWIDPSPTIQKVIRLSPADTAKAIVDEALRRPDGIA